MKLKVSNGNEAVTNEANIDKFNKRACKKARRGSKTFTVGERTLTIGAILIRAVIQCSEIQVHLSDRIGRKNKQGEVDM
jgi:hypothetical protein